MNGPSTLILSAPSKTFLTGEYAVLAGAPALVLNTTPRFELRATRNPSGASAGSVHGIPEGSPAAVWLRQRAPLLTGWDLQFVDPHEGRGGFGASGAQFLLVHAFTTHLQSGGKLPALHLEDVFQDYQVCSNSSGSGADILSQSTGSVALVDVATQRAEGMIWPYKDLRFAVIRTGIKLPTHLHLQTLNGDSLTELVAPAIEAAQNFAIKSAEEFTASVRNYAGALREAGLQSPRTLELLKPFEQQSWCLAAKGCGAWGADTILLLYPRHEEGEVLNFTRRQGLELVSQDLSPGLEISAGEQNHGLEQKIEV